MSAAYLEKLNLEQRAAVEHGISEGTSKIPGPLLDHSWGRIGKTNTLAHRVAHLIVMAPILAVSC